MRGTVLAAAAAMAAAQSAQMIWNQQEQYAVYTAAAISRHRGGSFNATPTFAVSTWLNPPIEVQVFNTTTSPGNNVWAFAASSNTVTFQVDMARHAYATPTGTVDTVVAQADFTLPSSCAVYGFVSTGSRASSVPVWSATIPQCDVGLLYDVDLMIDMSDDGSTAAFATYANNTQGVTTARVYVYDGQTGKQRYVYDLGTTVTPGPDGGVWVTENGNWVAYTNGDVIYVLDGMTGALRDKVEVTYGVDAAISNDGAYVLAASPDNAYVYAWTPSANSYVLSKTLTPPASESWYPYDLVVSTTATGTNLGSVGWIDGEALQARLTIYDMASGQLMTDISTAKNAKLQTTPTVRADAEFTAMILWGDDDDVWTVGLARAGSNNLVFNYTTPGSMFGVDVVVDTVTTATTTVYLAASGKAVPANMFGNGGDAYAWRITVPN